MKISVITICYNSARYLERTMASVLGQSHDDLEYIIVDGGSRDGTVDIIRAQAARDPRIRWISEPDGGISDAMNKGVRMASGEVVAHLHSDEYYLDSDVLSRVASCFDNAPDQVWLTGGFHFVNPAGNFVSEIRVRRYSYRRLIHSNIILHSATFVRREAFNSVGGFDLSLRFCMDYHLWLRLGALSDPVLLDRALSCFCVHDGSRSMADAGEAYAEEYRVRLDFLKRRGLWPFPYRMEYRVKKVLNRLFTRRLISSARQAAGGGPSC